MPRVSGKVATIITNSTLAFNIGSDMGVASGDTAYVRRRVEIRDPDTSERLGSVSVTVLQLRVNHVQQKLCTAFVTSLQDETSNSPLAARRTKRIADSPTDEKSGVSVYVRVGDPVEIQVRDEKNDEPPF